MEELGAPTMLVCSNVSPDAIDDDALAAEQLRALAERAAERGLRIAYEALAWGRHVNEYDHAWRIVARRRPPGARHLPGLLPHPLARHRPRRASPRSPARRSSTSSSPTRRSWCMDVLQWSRHYRCFPGQGAFDLADFVARVLAAGYAGPLSLEVFNDVFRQADPDRTAVDAMRSLLVLEDELGAAAAARPRARRLRVRRDRRRRRLGARDRGAAAAMGFAHVGPHRSKPVQLWQHGDIRVVLNHGAGDDDPEVVAVAVESADPDRSAARAEALLAPVLDRRRGPGEADLAAVAAPDGTSVFFCRTAATAGWLGDFLALEPARRRRRRRADRPDRPHRARAAVRRLRRGGAVLPLGARPAARRERRSSRRRTGWCAAARVASADGRVRIALNVPALAGAQRGQAELQHVAFACDDALAAARAMRERGAPLLRDPRQLLRRPRRPASSSTRRCSTRCASSACCTTATPAASSCTSTPATSGAACSSRSSSGAAATTATAPPTRPCGWRRSERPRCR